MPEITRRLEALHRDEQPQQHRHAFGRKACRRKRLGRSKVNNPPAAQTSEETRDDADLERDRAVGQMLDTMEPAPKGKQNEQNDDRGDEAVRHEAMPGIGDRDGFQGELGEQL